MRFTLALFALCSTLAASNLLVSVSGTYANNVPSTTYLAPNQPWSLTFNVDSNPTVSSSSSFASVISSLTNIHYTLNGVAIPVTGNDLEMFTSGTSVGGFVIKLGAANNSDLLNFYFGPQIFTGPTTSPTIQPGSYTYASWQPVDGLINTGFIQPAAITVQISGAPPILPSITTAPTLPPAGVGTFYAQALSVYGGTAPYSWSLVFGALPVELSLSSTGVITGTPTTVGTFNFTTRVTDAASASTTRTFSLTIGPSQTFTSALRIPQIVDGAGWKTRFNIINSSQVPVTFTFRFWGDDGSPLAFPILNGTPGLLSGTVAPEASFFAESAGTSSTLQQGWAEIASSRQLSASAVYQFSVGGPRDSLGTETATLSSNDIVMPFDNSQGNVTAIAIANSNPTDPITVSMLFTAEGGAESTSALVLAPHEHRAFVAPGINPAVEGLRGSIRFTAPSADIAVMGLEFTPTGQFTSVPTFQ